MCKIFAEHQIIDRIEEGEFMEKVVKSSPISPPFTDYKGQQCVRTEEVFVLDGGNEQIARCHRFITADGKVGASGLLDPKEFTIKGVWYRQHKKLKLCEFCEGGEPIPESERFYKE